MSEMTLERAAEILNKQRHHGRQDWVSYAGFGGCVKLPHSNLSYPKFDAIAIAEKYERDALNKPVSPTMLDVVLDQQGVIADLQKRLDELEAEDDVLFDRITGIAKRVAELETARNAMDDRILAIANRVTVAEIRYSEDRGNWTAARDSLARLSVDTVKKSDLAKLAEGSK